MRAASVLAAVGRAAIAVIAGTRARLRRLRLAAPAPAGGRDAEPRIRDDQQAVLGRRPLADGDELAQVVIELQDIAAKKASGRRIPIHARLRNALSELHNVDGGIGPVIRSERGAAMSPLSDVQFSRFAETEVAKLLTFGKPRGMLEVMPLTHIRGHDLRTMSP